MATGGQGRDIAREGTLTDPRNRNRAVPMSEALAGGSRGEGGLAAHLMERYAFHPQSGAQVTPDQIRVFSPGLNTAEPEASKRTQYYSSALHQSMLHLHNGSLSDTQLPWAGNFDYAPALLARTGLKQTPLMKSMEQLLQANFSQAEPQDIHAILYSDSTIGGTKAIARFREAEVQRRLEKSGGKRSREQVQAEVDALLKKHLFVELHGNAVDDLPEGPRYLVWTDIKDEFISRAQVPVMGQVGLDGRNRDQDNLDDAVYVDYNGPYKKADAHNLAANGVHVVNATLRMNGVQTPQELWEKAKREGRVAVPEGVKGDPTQLWNPTAAR
jgi:hypothetical protein